MIKQKKQLKQTNSYSYMDRTSLFNNVFKAGLKETSQSVQRENAQRKLEVMAQMRHSAKKNSPKKEGKEKKGLPDAKILTSSLSKSQSKKLELEPFLQEIEEGRRTCEFIVGNKGEHDLVEPKSFGVEASATPGCYKRRLESTATRGQQGWSDFIITYDNKIVLEYSNKEITEKKFKCEFDHRTMGCGTFFKAAGRIKIIDGKLFISPFSAYLELGWDYMPIILFVLQQKGLSISNETNNQTIFITDEKGNVIDRPKVGPKNKISTESIVAFYLNKHRFPLAKAKAENKKLDIEDILSDLFFNIDYSILRIRNKKLIHQLETEKNDFKIAIVEFLLKLTHSSTCLSHITDESIGQSLTAIIDRIKLLEDNHGIDLSFVKHELNSWIHYLFALNFQTKNNLATEKKGVEEMKVPEIYKALDQVQSNLKKLKESPVTLSQSSFIQFYSETPTKTCIALLRDYTKTSFWGRLLTLAWLRPHFQSVVQFLEKYDNQEYADNLSVQDIYRTVLNQSDTLAEFTGKKGRLFERLWFCEELKNTNSVASAANEAPSQSSEVISNVSSQNSETEKSESDEEYTPSFLPSAPVNIPQPLKIVRWEDMPTASSSSESESENVTVTPRLGGR